MRAHGCRACEVPNGGSISGAARHYAPARVQLHEEWTLREPIADMAQKVLCSKANNDDDTLSVGGAEGLWPEVRKPA